MGQRRTAGRWVIVFDEREPPLFWSDRRDALEILCKRLKTNCPKARVIWEETPRNVESSLDERSGCSDER